MENICIAVDWRGVLLFFFLVHLQMFNSIYRRNRRSLSPLLTVTLAVKWIDGKFFNSQILCFLLIYIFISSHFACVQRTSASEQNSTSRQAKWQSFQTHQEKTSGSPAAVQTSDDSYVGVSFIQPGFVHPWTKCFHPSWSVQLLLELTTRTFRHSSSIWMQISGVGCLLRSRYPTLAVYLITHTCPVLFQILEPAVWPPAAIAKGSGGYSRAS